MKKLPIGLQTLKNIIDEGYVYVDKTKEILPLFEEGKYYFLSRPRRFGKSLLVSTLKEIFLGNKELFKDLYIYDKIEWMKHPVIHIDYSVITYSESKEVFKLSMLNHLKDFAKNYGYELKSTILRDAFEELIKKLSELGKVVILIDEYDKPIIDFVTELDKAKENREVLKEFYSVIKGCDEYLKFVFITGVSKFSKVSIFSGLNNLKDITLSSNYSELLGWNENELDNYFSEKIKNLADKNQMDIQAMKVEIKKWYNGYSWDGEKKVFNPTSILNLFDELEFGNYWFATGTPTFLMNTIKNYKIDISDLDNTLVNESIFESYDIDNLEIYSLLFQTGYLTIKKVIKKNLIRQFGLNYPNNEVKESFLTHLLALFTNQSYVIIQPIYIELVESLEKKDIDKFLKVFKSLFAKIPYTLHLEKEAYYHSLFYMILSLMGCKIDLEVLTDKGRIDAVLEFDNLIYIIEFKLGSPEDAIKQIKERKYYEKYLHDNKEIILLGVGGFEEKEIRVMSEELRVNRLLETLNEMKSLSNP